jgi:diguanylate cyclase (GGDEF)-like protein
VVQRPPFARRDAPAQMRHLEPNVPANHKLASRPAELSAIHGARILVVAGPGTEDLRRLLLSFGMVVDAANGLAEATEQLNDQEYDLVIISRSARGLGDVSALRVVESTAHARHVPVVAEPRLSPRADVAGHRLSAHRSAHADLDAAELATLLLAWIPPRSAEMARAARRAAALATLSLQAELPGFDISAALDRLGGNAQLLASLVQRFAVEHGDGADEVVNAVRSRQLDRARAVLHRLKGAAHVVGATRIVESISRAEADIGTGAAEAALTALARDLAEAATAIRRNVLPAADAPPATNASLESRLGLPPAANNAADARPLVLAVDDEPVNLQTIVELLRTEFRLRVASDGRTALELAQHPDRPDVILLDIMMPGMNGYEVCRHLKEAPATRDIPVIFVTSIHDASAETRGLELGAVDYIVKPFNAGVARARVRTHVQLRRARMHLAQLSELDGLTGIANRRRFDDALATEWKRAARYGTPLALVMADIDFFKQLNDRYGHPAGDECLQRVARAMIAALRRPTDLAARVGGEEFAALLADTELDGALQVARAVADNVRALDIEHALSPYRRATVSCGAAVLRPSEGMAPLELLERADRALYRAKEAGRDRISA